MRTRTPVTWQPEKWRSVTYRQVSRPRQNRLPLVHLELQITWPMATLWGHVRNSIASTAWRWIPPRCFFHGYWRVADQGWHNNGMESLAQHLISNSFSVWEITYNTADLLLVYKFLKAPRQIKGDRKILRCFFTVAFIAPPNRANSRKVAWNVKCEIGRQVYTIIQII